MIKGQQPQTISIATIKEKARHSASVMGSLVLSGWRGTKYLADVELLMHFIGVHLIAKSVAKDIADAHKLNIPFNSSTALVAVKFEIENEITHIFNNHKT